MATVYVTLGAVGSMCAGGSVVDVLSGHSLRSETITSSGASATGALTAKARQMAKVNCATAIYASADSSVSATTGVYIAGGESVYMSLNVGDSVSVIDA